MPAPANPGALLARLYDPANLDSRARARLDLWAETLTAWLETLPATNYNRFKALATWKRLLEFQGCLPWEIDRAKVAGWLEHLEREGRAASTRTNYRVRLASFYRFCAGFPPMLAGDPLFAPGEKPFNPAEELSRPKRGYYQNASILRADEARALLRAIDRQTSLIGRRDYALILTALLSAIPLERLRSLQWKDLEERPEGRAAQGGGCGDPQRLDPKIRQAIHCYLHASGRLESIQPEDYIFCPVTDRLTPPRGLAEEWRAEKPISLKHLNYLLHMYAGWAGVDESKVNCASLRHTAAALQVEQGADEAGMQRRLQRYSLHGTGSYMQELGRMLGKRRPPLPRRPAFLRRPCPRPGPFRRKAGAPPGNFNSMKHGLRTRRLRPEDVEGGDIPPSQAFPEFASAPLDNEILVLKVMLRRAYRQMGEFESLEEGIDFLNAIGLASVRLGRLLVARKKQREASADDDEQLEELRRIAKEMGREPDW